MRERDDIISDFLAEAGWGTGQRHAMTADASFRSYERLQTNDTTAILMNAPPASNDSVGIFAGIAETLKTFGYSAPAILARDDTQGLLLLEDLGDDLFAQVCLHTPALERPLYEAAVDLLADLGTQPQPDDLQPYSDAVYRAEAGLVTDWYMRAAQGAAPPEAKAERFLSLVSDALSRIAPFDPVLVMRDYHAENLLWLPDRMNHARVGLLDFQDALMGHPAYDLVSLLEDARRDTATDLQQSMKARFVARTAVDAAEFDYAYCAIGAQRNLKIVGIFARLGLRDGKFGYLRLIPRVWDHLMRDLSHPELAALRGWVLTHVPAPTDQVLDKIRGYAHAS